MSQENSKKVGIASMILAGIVALLFWSELIFRNLPSLADVSIPAGTLGWSFGTTRLYFVILAILDVIGGVGAVLYIWATLKARGLSWLGKTVLLTVFALIIYGIVQFFVAFLLPTELQVVYWGIGIVYILMGFGLRALFQRQR